MERQLRIGGTPRGLGGSRRPLGCLRLALLCALSLLQGCGIGHYLRNRGLDFMDCFKINAGVGLGLAVDLRATDWFAPGLGYMSYTTNFGWDDRLVHGTWKECVVINTPREVVEAAIGDPGQRDSPDYDPSISIGRLALASVFLANERWIRNPRTKAVSVEYYSLFNFAPIASFVRSADPGRFFVHEGEKVTVRDKSIWDEGWFEAGATVVFVHARIGVNLFQIADFLTGIIGIDPARDDRRLVPEAPRNTPMWREGTYER